MEQISAIVATTKIVQSVPAATSVADRPRTIASQIKCADLSKVSDLYQIFINFSN